MIIPDHFEEKEEVYSRTKSQIERRGAKRGKCVPRLESLLCGGRYFIDGDYCLPLLIHFNSDSYFWAKDENLLF